MRSAILRQAQGLYKPAVLQDRFGFLAGKLQVNGRCINPHFSQILSRKCADGYGYKEGDQGDRRRTVSTMKVSDRA